MTTREQFSRAVLARLGSSNPSPEVVQFMMGWSIEESGHDLSHMASYNLWNTTLPMPGSTIFNSVGVQNYVSEDQGATANADTLNNGLYPSLIQALRTNDACALGFNGCNISPDVASDLSVWVNGTRNGAPDYVNAIHELSGISAISAANDVLGQGNVEHETLCTVTVDQLHIRAQPTSQSELIATYPRDSVLNFVEVVNGEKVAGNPHWGHSQQGHYFWLGGTDHPNG